MCNTYNEIAVWSVLSTQYIYKYITIHKIKYTYICDIVLVYVAVEEADHNPAKEELVVSKMPIFCGKKRENNRGMYIYTKWHTARTCIYNNHMYNNYI